tara:strand:- start:250 stop:603 length:354 start_codon:yes stop_codon:yes gene_type:complete
MNIGLCSGRHVVYTNEREHMDYHLFHSPVEDPTNVDVHEKVCREFIKNHITGDLSWKRSEDRRINLFVTGLSPLLTSFLKVWVENQERLEMTCGDLVLWHWDTETEQYVPQKWAMIT